MAKDENSNNKSAELDSAKLKKDIKDDASNAPALTDSDTQQNTKEAESQNLSTHFKKAVHKVNQKQKQNPKLFVIGGAVLAVIVIVLILLFLVFPSDYVRGDLTSFDLYSTKNVSEINDGTVHSTNSFNVGDPILIKMAFDVPASKLQQAESSDAQTEGDDAQPPADNSSITVNYTYSVKNSKDEEVRKGSFPISVTADSLSGQRYISIILSTKTSLPADSYTAELSVSDDGSSESQLVGRKHFRITGSEAAAPEAPKSEENSEQ